MKRKYLAILAAAGILVCALTGCRTAAPDSTGKVERPKPTMVSETPAPVSETPAPVSETPTPEAAALQAGLYTATACTDSSGTEMELSGDVLELNEDGTGTFRLPDEKLELELQWQQDGTAISFTDEQGDKFSGTWNEDGTIVGDYTWQLTTGELIYHYTFALYQ